MQVKRRIFPDEDGCPALYPLTAKRVRLCRLEARHLSDLARTANDERISRYTGRIPWPYSLEDARAFLIKSRQTFENGEGLDLAVERIADGAFLGMIGLQLDPSCETAEIGYWFGGEHWNQGYASETAARFIAHAFEDLALMQLKAFVVPENLASVRVLEKLGFQAAGRGTVPTPAHAAGTRQVDCTVLTRAAYRAARNVPLLLVAAVALLDRDNRVLLQKRPLGKNFAGLWEFPGGKIEPGETPEQALTRELDEELGIDVRSACLAPLAFASHAYDAAHLLMPLYVCRHWRGVPSPREGQELAWVRGPHLRDYPMPPADVPLIPLLQNWI